MSNLLRSAIRLVSCPDPTHTGEGLVVLQSSLVPSPTQKTGEGLAHFERFLGCADSAGTKNHSLNQIAVFQNVIKNHMIVMKSKYYRPACASCTMQQARAESILCANVHTTRAKAKYAHNHVTAESAQPRNRSKCARPSPVLWVGSGHETRARGADDIM